MSIETRLMLLALSSVFVVMGLLWAMSHLPL